MICAHASGQLGLFVLELENNDLVVGEILILNVCNWEYSLWKGKSEDEVSNVRLFRLIPPIRISRTYIKF